MCFFPINGHSYSSQKQTALKIYKKGRLKMETNIEENFNKKTGEVANNN
jgi:hypothetical protein